MTSIKSRITSTCNAFHSFTAATATTCSASYRCLSTRDSRYHERRHNSHQRGYATTTSRAEKATPPDLLCWPETLKGHTCPTPYQIFAISRSAPYSKARFYELVKLYHPDRSNNNTMCSEATKIERYRLVVAAHTLLSDPAKRNAYDRFGAGWAGKSDSPISYPYSSSQAQAGPFTSGEYGEHEPNIWANATWEDWERWRDRKEGRNRDAPQYLANSTFVSLVLVFVAIGSSLNFNRAEVEGERYLAARDAIHDQASKDLRKVRQSTHQRPKDERIDWFLKNREAAMLGVGVDELKDEEARHVLPPQENCMPETPKTDDD